MPAEPLNPYAPPTATRPRPASSGWGRRWGEVAARALAVVVGFSLVADPTTLSGPLIQAVGGHVFVRGVGLVVLALGFFPWPRSRSRPRTKVNTVEEIVEDL